MLSEIFAAGSGGRFAIDTTLSTDEWTWPSESGSGAPTPAKRLYAHHCFGAGNAVLITIVNYCGGAIWHRGLRRGGDLLCKCPIFLSSGEAPFGTLSSTKRGAKMFLGPRITLGAFVPDDYGAMYCWANDIAAARLDGAFGRQTLGKSSPRMRPAATRRGSCWRYANASIRRSSAISTSITSTQFTARRTSGMRIGDERHRGQGFRKEALAMALNYCWNHLDLERVGLVVFRHNARAIAAYSACGFKKEGFSSAFCS